MMIYFLKFKQRKAGSVGTFPEKTAGDKKI
jgi:hypothetical protein